MCRRFYLLCLLLALAASRPVQLVGVEPASRVADEFPPELVRFRPFAANPIFTAEGAGHWDRKIRERGWILRCGATWHMWYTGYDDPAQGEGTRLLGHATSSDGLHWTPDPANPLLKDLWVEDMTVSAHEGQFFMFAEGLHDHAHWLTSPDGAKWTPQGPIVVRQTDGKPFPDGPIGTPTVWFDEGQWHLLIERGDKAVWLATSQDLKAWTLVTDDPVLLPGPGEYDRAMIAVDQVIKYRGRYYAYYHGASTSTPPQVWTTNVAVSDDAVHWRKYAHNPLVPGDRSSGLVVAEPPASSPRPVTSATACDGCEFPERAQFRLYTMHARVEAFLPAE